MSTEKREIAQDVNSCCEHVMLFCPRVFPGKEHRTASKQFTANSSALSACSAFAFQKINQAAIINNINNNHNSSTTCHVLVMAIFSKRLNCFYCGRRSNQPIQSVSTSVRKFHCEHCEADNYLDQVRYPRLEDEAHRVSTANLTLIYRMEKLQTLQQQKQTLKLTDLTRKALVSSPLASENRTCFVPNVFATNICLRPPWQHTNRPPMTHLPTMNHTTSDIVAVKKTDIRQYATIANRA